MTLLTWVNVPTLLAVEQTVRTHNLTEIRRKYWALRVQPFKVIQGHRSVANDFLLVTHVNVSRTVSEIKVIQKVKVKVIHRKTQIFPTPCI